MFRSKLAQVLVAVVGVGLLIFTVQRVGGWPAVVSGITSVGWWFILVVAIAAARMACRACAWIACIDGGGLSFREAFWAGLAGDAAGNLTPLGAFASEPTRIMMARSKLSTVTSVASIAIENAFYIASVLCVFLAGTWILLQRADVPAGLERISEWILGAVVVAALAAFWAARTQPAVLSRLAPLVTRLAGRSEAPAEAVKEIEARIYGVLRWPLGRILRLLTWYVLFHGLAVAEVWVVMRLLPGGDRIAFADVFLMESAGRFVTVAFKFVPYRLGVDEIGSGAVAQVLGLPPAIGVTVALVRRLRIVCLNAVGLLALTKRS